MLLIALGLCGCESKTTREAQSKADAANAQLQQAKERQSSNNVIDNLLEACGMKKGVTYYSQQANKANAELAVAKRDDKLKMITIAIAVIVLIIIVLLILNMRKRPNVVAAGPASMVGSGATSMRGAKYSATDVQAMCAARGLDYNTIVQQCGSIDAAGHYLTTGMSSSPW